MLGEQIHNFLKKKNKIYSFSLGVVWIIKYFPHPTSFNVG